MIYVTKKIFQILSKKKKKKKPYSNTSPTQIALIKSKHQTINQPLILKALHKFIPQSISALLPEIIACRQYTENEYCLVFPTRSQIYDLYLRHCIVRQQIYTRLYPRLQPFLSLSKLFCYQTRARNKATETFQIRAGSQVFKR